jgi:GTP-binding protein
VFVDRARIIVKAGDGGGGHVSFRRAKGLPKGGPNGGDGGRGGDIVLAADEGLNTLIDFKGVTFWKAENGESGGKKQCHGADAEDRVIRVPPGTMVFDAQTGEQLADIGPGERAVLAKGGRGGFGNEHFKSPTNQAPRSATPGEPGEERELRLELKVIAEVGLVGLPNAGKSTLLKAITRANPKVGAYPFTTLAPQLGIAELERGRRIVLADIPGLIEGAADGAGLGHDFLRHIERTKVIVHLLDAVPPDESRPADNYRAIRGELLAYSSELAEKPEVIALNKLDLLGDEAERKAAVDGLRAELRLGREHEVFGISGAAGVGLTELLERLWSMLHAGEPEPAGWDSPAAEAGPSA